MKTLVDEAIEQVALVESLILGNIAQRHELQRKASKMETLYNDESGPTISFAEFDAKAKAHLGTGWQRKVSSVRPIQYSTIQNWRKSNSVPARMLKTIEMIDPDEIAEDYDPYTRDEKMNAMFEITNGKLPLGRGKKHEISYEDISLRMQRALPLYQWDKNRVMSLTRRKEWVEFLSAKGIVATASKP